MTRPRIALAFVVLLSGACHAYAPASPAAVSPGDQVRALLTAEQFAAFEDVLPAGNRSVEGTVLSADAGELLLEVPVLTQLEGMRVESLRQRLRVPDAGVADLELRSLSRGRTIALVSAVAALAGYVAWDQIFSESDRNPTPPDGPVTELRRIVFQVPW